MLQGMAKSLKIVAVLVPLLVSAAYALWPEIVGPIKSAVCAP